VFVGLFGLEVIVLAPTQTIEERYILQVFFMAVMGVLRVMEEGRDA
jgi:hypothetical protein